MSFVSFKFDMTLIGSDTKYPLAMFLVAVGFFFVAVVEIVVSNCHGGGAHGHSHGDDLEESTRLFEDASSTVAIYTMVFGLSGEKLIIGSLIF